MNGPVRLTLKLVAPLVVCSTLQGCMGGLSAAQSNSLTIEPSQYRVAFDAAASETRRMGYEVVLQDRSNGIVESGPRHAGGALEPWRIDNDGFGGATGNTIASRRRRIRVEFLPVGLKLDSALGEGALHGPALPGSTAAQDRFDLQVCTQPIEMRVWVYIERSFAEGSKPSTYSGALASKWTNPLNAKPTDATDESVREKARWTPVGRDEAYETTLRDRIESATTQATPPPPQTPPPAELPPAVIP